MIINSKWQRGKLEALWGKLHRLQVGELQTVPGFSAQFFLWLLPINLIQFNLSKVNRFTEGKLMKCPDFLKSTMKQIFSNSSLETYLTLPMKFNVLHFSFLYLSGLHKREMSGRGGGSKAGMGWDHPTKEVQQQWSSSQMCFWSNRS